MLRSPKDEDDMSDAPAVVRASGLGFAYPDHELLRGLDFTLHPGLSFVRGGDGRGKTTLLRLLAGKLQPTAGTLERTATPVFHENMADPALDGVTARAWLQQCRARFPGWQEAPVEDLVDAFALRPHLDKTFHMLSTGSRRKVGLVAAMACGAPLTLLDMPFSGLDAPSRRALCTMLDTAARGTTRSWVLADYEIAEELGAVPFAGVIDLGD